MEIVFNNLTYEIDQKKILDQITFTIKPGKIYSIVGPSGSGKTTLLHLMNGLIFPTSGSLKVGSHTLSKRAHLKKMRSHIGFVGAFPEQYFFHKTVKEEMEYFYQFCDSFEGKSRILEVLELVGLQEADLYKNLNTLSEGEKRKVSLALVLLKDPEYLFLDEPTLGIDSKDRKEWGHLLKKINKDLHKTIVLVSNDIDFVYELTDHVLLLKEGKIIANGEKFEIFTNVNLLKKHEIPIPRLVLFPYKVLKLKGIKMGYRCDINDLIKDVYRYVK